MTKRGGRKASGGGCLCAPIRALSRACDSACDLYVRGMSGCAVHVPSGAAGAVGRGFGRSAATSSSMLQRASSDRADDLVRAAARNRRVAPAPEAPVADHDGAGKMKGGAATATLITSAAPAVKVVVPARKKGAATVESMGTIAEDAPCEFGADSACVWPPPASRRRGAAAGARPGGFGAIKASSEVWARGQDGDACDGVLDLDQLASAELIS